MIDLYRRDTIAAKVAVDVALVTLALGDGLLAIYYDPDPQRFALAWIAALGLFLRRRLPIVSLLLALPQLALSSPLLAAAIALYTVARSNTRAATMIAASVAVFASNMWMDISTSTVPDIILDVGYSALIAIGPATLGWSLRTRAELVTRMAQLAEAREHESAAVAAHALSQERARLAREMHDVVSHQVSLIAVQTGALQVSATDPQVRKSATKVRSLAVQTLDELRQMVGVLRAAGGEAEGIEPQPTSADLAKLVDNSGIDVTTDIQLPTSAPVAVQRAVYRTIQEGLTNVRKHAPGSAVTVQVETVGAWITVRVDNTAPTATPVALPSARHGLIGLAERADLLGGNVDAGPTPDGGHSLTMRLPLR